MRYTFLSTFSVFLLLVSSPDAATWRIHGGQGNEVKFVSSAPMETFEGVTDRVTGSIAFAGETVEDSVTVRITVDLASIDTGIGKRNTHMRERHLETDTYPVAVFSGVAVNNGGKKLISGATETFEVVGLFDLHGVARRITVPVDVVLNADGSLGLVARFVVALTDHNISRPKFLFLKLNETQDVTVTLTAVPE